jgi:hypothetical protein
MTQKLFASFRNARKQARNLGLREQLYSKMQDIRKVFRRGMGQGVRGPSAYGSG